MAALSRAELDREWRQSIARLSVVLGDAVKVASVPGGYYSREVGESAAAAGIEALFTSEPTARVEMLDGCRVLGRYVVQRGMAPRWSAGFAAGRASQRWRTDRAVEGQARGQVAGRREVSPTAPGHPRKKGAEYAGALHACVCRRRFAQSVPLKDRVLILVNSRVPESISVGQYYAAKRNIPAANILRLETASTEVIRRRSLKSRSRRPCASFWTRTMAQCAARSSISFPPSACR